MKRLLVIAVFLAGAFNAFSQVADTALWAPNGPVNALLLKDSLLFVGGDFDQVSPVTGNFAAFDSITADISVPFPKVNGKINCMVRDSAGYIYVGGLFGKVGNADCFNLFRLTPQGNFDPTFLPNPDGEVFELIFAWRTIFIAGDFSSYDGFQRGRGAALYLPNDSLTPFDPIADGPIYALCADTIGMSIIVGGDYGKLGNDFIAYFGRVDPNTGIAAHNGPPPWTAIPQIFGPVRSLAILKNRIYIGGDFDTFANFASKGIGVVNATTGVFLPQYSAGLNGYVSELKLIGNKIYLAGDFSVARNTVRLHLAAIDTTFALLPWNAHADGPVNAIEFSKDSTAIYVAGAFHTLKGDTCYNAGLILLDSLGTVLNWNPKLNGPSSAIITATNSNRVFIGGGFSGAGGVLRENLCAININSKAANNWNPKVNAPVTTLCGDNSKLFVSGNFTSVNGQSRDRIAAFDLSTLVLSSFNPGVNGLVRTMVSDNQDLFLGGNFTVVGGQNRNSIASISIASATTTTWNPNCAGTVNKILIDNNQVYVGGFFTQCGSQIRNNLARLNKTTGLADWSWSCDTDDGIYDLDLYNGQLYIGGWFQTVAGQGRNYIAAIDTFSGNLLPFYPTIGNYIHGFARWNDDLFIAGAFTFVNGNLIRPNLCNYDIGDGMFDGFAPSPDIFPQTMQIDQNNLYVGGTFSTVGYRYHPNLCLLNIMWVTEIPENSMPEFTLEIWPNPISDFVNVAFPFSNEKSTTIEVIDINGKVVRKEVVILSSDNYKMNLEGIAPGMYSIRLRSGTGVCYSSRLIKN